MAKAKPFKPPVGAICTLAVGLDVRFNAAEKTTTRKAFSEADVKQLFPKPQRKHVHKLITWAKDRSMIQGPASGPFVLTAKGQGR